MELSRKDKIKLFFIRNGVDMLLGLAIVVILVVGALTAEEVTAENLKMVIPFVLAIVVFYISRMINKKNMATETQKEMHNKLYYNVEKDFETGHYDIDLRYQQLKAFRANMIITDDEYRELKARYDRDQKTRRN